MTPHRPPTPGLGGRGRVRRRRLLKEEDVRSLLDATAGELLEARDRALLGLLYGAGLRVGEVARLTVPEVLMDDEGVIVVGKRWRVRFVPVAAVVLGWIATYLGGRIEGPVFLAEHGGPMGSRLIRKVVDKYAAKAELPKTSPHTLRHSAASHMLARGIYLPRLASWLGHESLETTAVYLHEVPFAQSLEEQYRATHPLAEGAR